MLLSALTGTGASGMQSRLLLTPTNTVYINQTLAQVLVIPRIGGRRLHDLRTHTP